MLGVRQRRVHELLQWRARGIVLEGPLTPCPVVEAGPARPPSGGPGPGRADNDCGGLEAQDPEEGCSCVLPDHLWVHGFPVHRGKVGG